MPLSAAAAAVPAAGAAVVAVVLHEGRSYVCLVWRGHWRAAAAVALMVKGPYGWRSDVTEWMKARVVMPGVRACAFAILTVLGGRQQAGAGLRGAGG